MQIGTVIRKYRKEKNMTQEEMASYLGVTAPAVNKWENGNACPDIMLLAPIARLLGISTDTLLSYREELTKQEIANISNEIGKRLMKEPYEDVFRSAMQKIQEYPNCGKLAFVLAQISGRERLLHCIMNVCELGSMSWHKVILIEYRRNG